VGSIEWSKVPAIKIPYDKKKKRTDEIEMNQALYAHMNNKRKMKKIKNFKKN
jgi:hypothetical protein